MFNKILKYPVYTSHKVYRTFKTHYYKINELPKVVFIHVPKCGGTSISEALQNKYHHSYYKIHTTRVSEASKLYFKTQKKQWDGKHFSDRQRDQAGFGINLFYAALKGKKCLTGHVVCNSEMIVALREMDFKFVTIIRNPVDRIFSEYFFNFYKQSDFYSTSLDFEKYLNKRHGSIYVRFFGGYRADECYDSNEAIEAAVENLKEYEIIGRLDEMDLFVNNMKQEIELSLKIPASNKNPAPREKYASLKNSPEKRARVRDICRPDIKLIKQLEALNLIASLDSVQSSLS